MKTRILIVDDHQIIREGLISLIDKQDDMEVVGQCENGRDAIEMAIELKPQVILMDISMPGLNGIDATEQIKKQCPQSKILALSMNNCKRMVSSMLKAGAAGYILKECAFTELIRAVAAVKTGHTYLSPGLTDIIVEDYVMQLTAPSTDRVQSSQLSSREREVLQLIAEGFSTKEIALQLHVSAKTIATHREHIMEKLDIHNVASLTKYAVQEGLTTL